MFLNKVILHAKHFETNYKQVICDPVCDIQAKVLLSKYEFRKSFILLILILISDLYITQKETLARFSQAGSHNKYFLQQIS